MNYIWMSKTTGEVCFSRREIVRIALSDLRHKIINLRWKKVWIGEGYTLEEV